MFGLPKPAFEAVEDGIGQDQFRGSHIDHNLQRRKVAVEKSIEHSANLFALLRKSNENRAAICF